MPVGYTLEETLSHEPPVDLLACRQDKTGNAFAIKAYRGPEHDGGEEARSIGDTANKEKGFDEAQVRKEVSTMSRLKHPRIIKLREVSPLLVHWFRLPTYTDLQTLFDI